MRSTLRWLLAICLCAGVGTSCAGKDKFQDKMKGLWVLQSRTLPDGKVLSPPAISGRLEWFPLDVDKRTAHVSVLATHGDDDLQIHGSHYDLGDYSSFTQETYVTVGGGIDKTHDKTFSTERTTRSGSISVEGSTITFTHDNGPVYVFAGSKLTIKHRDGTVDLLAK